MRIVCIRLVQRLSARGSGLQCSSHSSHEHGVHRCCHLILSSPQVVNLPAQVCCQQPLQRVDTLGGDGSGGSGSGSAGADPAAWQTAEGIPYAEVLNWLQSRISEVCPGRDMLRFGLQRLASDRLAALGS